MKGKEKEEKEKEKEKPHLKLEDRLCVVPARDDSPELVIRDDDLVVIVRQVVFAPWASPAVERDRRSHVRWRDGHDRPNEPLGAREAGVEAKDAAVVVRDVL